MDLGRPQRPSPPGPDPGATGRVQQVQRSAQVQRGLDRAQPASGAQRAGCTVRTFSASESESESHFERNKSSK